MLKIGQKSENCLFWLSKKKTTNLQKCRLLWNQINKQYNFIQLHHVLCPPFDVYLNNKHHKMRWTAKRNHLNFENQKKITFSTGFLTAIWNLSIFQRKSTHNLDIMTENCTRCKRLTYSFISWPVNFIFISQCAVLYTPHFGFFSFFISYRMCLLLCFCFGVFPTISLSV